MSSLGPLVLIAPIPTRILGNRIRLTKKFVSGVNRYVAAYPGEVKVFLPPGDDDSNLDGVELDRSTLDFDVDVLPFDGRELRRRLLGAGVVLGTPHHLLGDLGVYLREQKIPFVLCTEYTLRTRLQIARAEVQSTPRLVRRAVFELGEEIRTLRNVRNAAAVQCNGTPTFEAYRLFAKEALLFFDSRIDAAMLPSEQEIRARVTAKRRRPTVLVYSGRFHAMKGVDHLPRVADVLSRRGTKFEFHLFGDGPMLNEVKAAVHALGLDETVRFHGSVPFEKELMPWVRANADLFVCCHRQGDPSCTYLETLACGVPIAGYANEAFRGLLSVAGEVGTSVPMDHPEALAHAIADSVDDEDWLLRASVAAAAFASRHRFEDTFDRRLAQLRRLAIANSPGEGSYLDASPAMAGTRRR